MFVVVVMYWTVKNNRITQKKENRWLGKIWGGGGYAGQLFSRTRATICCRYPSQEEISSQSSVPLIRRIRGYFESALAINLYVLTTTISPARVV